MAWRLLIVICALSFAASTADGAIYSYVDWTTANANAGTASGVITLPDLSIVNVNFAATFSGGAPGRFAFAQTSGGTNCWSRPAPHIRAKDENATPTPDILALEGGNNQIYTVTLSQAVKDPIMAIVSLGRSGLPTTYDFDSPFTIVSQGVGFFGGGPAALVQLPGDILEG